MWLTGKYDLAELRKPRVNGASTFDETKFWQAQEKWLKCHKPVLSAQRPDGSELTLDLSDPDVASHYDQTNHQDELYQALKVAIIDKNEVTRLKWKGKIPNKKFYSLIGQSQTLQHLSFHFGATSIRDFAALIAANTAITEISFSGSFIMIGDYGQEPIPDGEAYYHLRVALSRNTACQRFTWRGWLTNWNLDCHTDFMRLVHYSFYGPHDASDIRLLKEALSACGDPRYQQFLEDKLSAYNQLPLIMPYVRLAEQLPAVPTMHPTRATPSRSIPVSESAVTSQLHQAKAVSDDNSDTASTVSSGDSEIVLILKSGPRM